MCTSGNCRSVTADHVTRRLVHYREIGWYTLRKFGIFIIEPYFPVAGTSVFSGRLLDVRSKSRAAAPRTSDSDIGAWAARWLEEKRGPCDSSAAIPKKTATNKSKSQKLTMSDSLPKSADSFSSREFVNLLDLLRLEFFTTEPPPRCPTG